MGFHQRTSDWPSRAEEGLAMVHQLPSRAHKRRQLNPSASYNTFKNKVAREEQESPLLILLAENILANVVLRSNLYLVLTAVFTVFASSIAPYKSLFFVAAPDNVLETYFMPYIWLWATLAVLPVALITGFVFDRVEGIVYAVTRVAVAIGVWFAFTNFFHLIHFDVAPDVRVQISGHCFVLCWFVLFVVEESRALSTWNDLITLVTSSSEPSFIFDPFVHHVRRCTNNLTILSRMGLIMMTIFVLVSDLLLISSLAFFHSWLSKLVSLALAILVWLLLYRGLYELPLKKGGTPHHMALVALARVELTREETEREKK